ncbi:RBBP9/YdeN family alpha/beta hydrolase [Caballeronia ptereochthonis]|uniref:Alpha/beta hydrolase n=1 Tax=Caballeronia ptereochthonis TaxID=1777144 RepID=A0A158AVD9_9BURK|nr:alpha/beta hydrolase [Caballeronia ptereochthonis]SAK61620.1 alpha/beta hydrolase [Caballeronia ptereochthonis]
MSERSAAHAWGAASSLSSVTLVTVPGLYGSEDAHWQTWLEREMPFARRVEQRDWDAPHLDTWSDAVRDVLASVEGPVVLAAHSFGCLATAHALSHARVGAAPSHGARVKGVLFVAPASPAKFRFAGAFSARRLDTLSLVVGSETDPWMPLDEARTLAQRWNSAFVNLGKAGHINTASGFGPWPLARHFVETLARRAAPEYDEEDAEVERRAYG